MVLALWLEARGGLRGLYLRCSLDGPPCKALVDTGSTISLLRLRFTGHHRRSLGGMVVDQRPPDVCDGAGDWNEGEKRRVGDQESRIVRLRHEGAWLPPGPCIPSGPVSAAFPSRKTAEAVHALWLHSGV
ncbi:unnamed protein product [Gadus morhua 'NCC']